MKTSVHRYVVVIVQDRRQSRSVPLSFEEAAVQATNYKRDGLDAFVAEATANDLRGSKKRRSRKRDQRELDLLR